MGSIADHRETRTTKRKPAKPTLTDLADRLDRIERAFVRSRVSDEDRDGIIEAVRVRLLRLMQDRPATTYADIATLAGYESETIAKFCRREYASFALAENLIATFPELGEGITCRDCGAIVTGGKKR